MHSQTQTLTEFQIMERRQNTLTTPELWNRLTLSQQFSASSLNQYGYDLAFIRNTQAGSLAILLCSDKAATINNEGEIDTSPDIIIR
jgi:hypothetical protein